METVSDYMARKHASLGDSYRHEDRRYADSCFIIAREVEKRLKAEGRNPQLFWLRGQICDNMKNRELIVPKINDGKIVWAVHVVAVADNLVFDPMIGEPVAVREYPRIAFEGNPEMLPVPYRFD